MNKNINRKSVLIMVIILIMMLSSIKVLDNYTDEYTTEAITSAAITYATARGINALVSVLQSTTINAGVVFSGSLSVGELLDPLNDLIERFSGIMTLVLGSLAAQKVLLAISSHQTFQVLIFFMGAALILAIQFRKTPMVNLLFKLFLILVFIRFSLGIAVFLNSGMDKLFLLDQTRLYENKIKAFEQSLLSLNEMVVIEEQNNQKNDRLKALSIEYSQLAEANSRQEIERDKAQLRLINATKLVKQFGYKRFNPFTTNPDLLQAKEEVNAAKESLEIIEDDFRRRLKRMDDIMTEINQLKSEINGKPINALEVVKEASKALINSLDLSVFENKVSQSINNFMNLVAVFLLKTLVFPLLFFYFFLQMVKTIWRSPGVAWLAGK